MVTNLKWMKTYSKINFPNHLVSIQRNKINLIKKLIDFYNIKSMRKLIIQLRENAVQKYLRPKKDGKIRIILDLKNLNKAYIEKNSFQNGDSSISNRCDETKLLLLVG